MLLVRIIVLNLPVALYISIFVVHSTSGMLCNGWNIFFPLSDTPSCTEIMEKTPRYIDFGLASIELQQGPHTKEHATAWLCCCSCDLHYKTPVLPTCCPATLAQGKVMAYETRVPNVCYWEQQIKLLVVTKAAIRPRLPTRILNQEEYYILT